MSNYIYFRNSESSLLRRYDREQPRGEGYGINGLEDWERLVLRLLTFLGRSEDEISPDRQNIRRETIGELREISGGDGLRNSDWGSLDRYDRSTEELIAMLLLLRLRTIYRPLPPNGCPRVFISHRRIDKGCALRMAQLALDAQFAFWLDVLDPDLTSLNGSAFPEKLIPLMTACIIEMALINCTHVLACMTNNSRGTLWIPYEYGRIRELPGLSVNTCAWLHPDLAMPDFPEYMMLGETAKNESRLSSWLLSERLLAGNVYCNPGREDLSALGAIERLPDKKSDILKRQKEEFMQWIKDGMPLKSPLAVPKRATFKKKNRIT